MRTSLKGVGYPAVSVSRVHARAREREWWEFGTTALLVRGMCYEAERGNQGRPLS